MKKKDIYYYNNNILKLDSHIAHDIEMYAEGDKKFKTSLSLNELITLGLLYCYFHTFITNAIITSQKNTILRLNVNSIYYDNMFYKVKHFYCAVGDGEICLVTFRNGHQFIFKNLHCSSNRNYTITELNRMLHYVNKHFC